MRLFLIAAACLGVSASVAPAQDDVMASRYGNTTITKTASGHELHTYYKPDHTFTGKIVDVGFDIQGTWKVDGGTLCLIYDPALPTVSNPVCQPVVDHKVGETWTGEDHTSTLVPGIQ